MLIDGTIQYKLLYMEGREVQVYSGNGKLYGLVEAFMERAMRNKSGKSGWDEYLEKTTCARLKSLDFIW